VGSDETSTLSQEMTVNQEKKTEHGNFISARATLSQVKFAI
jgi:hypothetical protein